MVIIWAHNSGHNSGLGSRAIYNPAWDPKSKTNTADPYYGCGGSITAKDLVNSPFNVWNHVKKIDPTHLDPGQIDRDPIPYIP